MRLLSWAFYDSANGFLKVISAYKYSTMINHLSTIEISVHKTKCRNKTANARKGVKYNIKSNIFSYVNVVFLFAQLLLYSRGINFYKND